MQLSCPRESSAAELPVLTLFTNSRSPLCPLTLTLHVRPQGNPSSPIAPLLILILHSRSQSPSQRCPPSLTWVHLSLEQVMGLLWLDQKG